MWEKQLGEGMGDDEKRIETLEKRVLPCCLLPASQLHKISHQGSHPSGFLPLEVSPAPG